MAGLTLKDRLYTQNEVIDKIGETLLSPTAYSLGCLHLKSPFVLPLLEAFPGTYLHVYYYPDDTIESMQGNVRYSKRVTLVPKKESYPVYLTRLDPLQSFYDYAIAGELEKPHKGAIRRIWPRVNIGGIMVIYGNNLKHNKIGMEIRYKRKWVVLMGCCRGATQYIHAILSKAKLIIGHQHYKQDGIIGGETTGIVMPEGTIAIHQVRSPLGVIASSSRRARKLSPYCAPLIGYAYEGDHIKWGMHYWYYWNRLAERKAQWTYRVEDLNSVWEEFCRRLDVEQYEPRDVPVNKNSSKGLKDYPTITWRTLYDLDAELTEKIRELAIHYGYELN